MNIKAIIIGIVALVAIYFLFFMGGGDPTPSKKKNAWEKSETVGEKGKYQCPAPNVVGYYQDKVGGFSDQRLDWTVDNINADVGLNMRFAQAVYLETQNSFSCNYEWPNPKDPGTWIVVTVHLIPNAALKVQILGKKWKEEGISRICISRDPTDCTFNLSRKKRK